jgi:hypothetical protein
MGALHSSLESTGRPTIGISIHKRFYQGESADQDRDNKKWMHGEILELLEASKQLE